MEIEIRPEPSPEERAAIAAAVKSLQKGVDGVPWWLAGLPDDESAFDDGPDQDRP